MNRLVKVSLLSFAAVLNSAQAAAETELKTSEAGETPAMDVLSDEQWEQVDATVTQALAWLAGEQRQDGSFPTRMEGQPAVTSLCVMAFLANGHVPGEGPYGDALRNAIKFVQSTQKQHGVLALAAPDGLEIPRRFSHFGGKCVAYNHAIGSLMLSEAYAMHDRRRDSPAAAIIEKAIAASLKMQGWEKTKAVDLGGWRYAHDDGYCDSDLSLTGWELMFLRSAKNAGFEVPKEPIDKAVEYVLRCYRPDFQTFNYAIWPDNDRRSRGMAGAGVLALAHAGKHRSKEALTAGEWILANDDFHEYNRIKTFQQVRWYNDRYHYGIFYCSQGMYQLGGDYWKKFFPDAVDALVTNQRTDGSWPQETSGESGRFGSTYSTALCILALSAPNQLLPIFQR